MSQSHSTVSSPHNRYTLQLGGDDGSNAILDINAIQKLNDGTLIGGKWKIYRVKKPVNIPRKPNYCMISVHLLDGYEELEEEQNNIDVNTNKLLEGRIWQHPKSHEIPQKNSILIIKDHKAKIGTFNGIKQIHVNHKYVEYLTHEQLRAMYKQDDDQLFTNHSFNNL